MHRERLGMNTSFVDAEKRDLRGLACGGRPSCFVRHTRRLWSFSARSSPNSVGRYSYRVTSLGRGGVLTLMNPSRKTHWERAGIAGGRREITITHTSPAAGILLAILFFLWVLLGGGTRTTCTSSPPGLSIHDGSPFAIFLQGRCEASALGRAPSREQLIDFVLPLVRRGIPVGQSVGNPDPEHQTAWPTVRRGGRHDIIWWRSIRRLRCSPKVAFRSEGPLHVFGIRRWLDTF